MLGGVAVQLEKGLIGEGAHFIDIKGIVAILLSGSSGGDDGYLGAQG